MAAPSPASPEPAPAPAPATAATTAAASSATAALLLRLLQAAAPLAGPVWEGPELAAAAGPDEAYAPAPGRDATGYEVAPSKYNPTPGTGRTGFLPVPPNPYPFYGPSEKYVPVVQADGGQLSEWEPMYAPSREQAEADRARAYEAGVPHGYVAPGSDASASEARLELWVVSELHDDSEYGPSRDPATGCHSGGAFVVRVGARTRLEALRAAIRDAGGIPPALQKLSYAGKALDDSQRTLEHYGVAYWHKRFPHWPIKIRRF
ncbi:hypothetical protein HYH03_004638 [Edaphochlamys debaryana]|uniref:Ubiquitin-like domain-containing protein n=1 Tax=Edaphochlamys debaryana TaxID=47281 RepID=A0A836C253_9CHLO|nr:hypothetical protein HYH03_004638 [Edaphochlamys debaryana]|eukprot:KAG2497485.1 hypothetical protein HYH03_004638 [Edaphochlamys debaryana]